TNAAGRARRSAAGAWQPSDSSRRRQRHDPSHQIVRIQRRRSTDQRQHQARSVPVRRGQNGSPYRGRARTSSRNKRLSSQTRMADANPNEHPAAPVIANTAAHDHTPPAPPPSATSPPRPSAPNWVLPLSPVSVSLQRAAAGERRRGLVFQGPPE